MTAIEALRYMAQHVEAHGDPKFAAWAKGMADAVERTAAEIIMALVEREGATSH